MLTWDYARGELDGIDFLIGIGLEGGQIATDGKGNWEINEGRGQVTRIRGAEKFAGYIREHPEIQQRLRNAVVPGGGVRPAKKKVVVRRRRN
jgi:hypothetical protein